MMFVSVRLRQTHNTAQVVIPVTRHVTFHIRVFPHAVQSVITPCTADAVRVGQAFQFQAVIESKVIPPLPAVGDALQLTAFVGIGQSLAGRQDTFGDAVILVVFPFQHLAPGGLYTGQVLIPVVIQQQQFAVTVSSSPIDHNFFTGIDYRVGDILELLA